MDKVESRARNRLAVAVVVSILSAILAIALGLNHSELVAVLFLVVAVAAAAFAWVAYRRYSALRAQRWQEELSGTERQLGEMWEQAGGNTSPTDTARDNSAEG